MLKKILLFCWISFLTTSFAHNNTSSASKNGMLQIPPRPAGAMSGSEFMQSIINMNFADRENAILNELLTGNIPEFLRELIPIEVTYNDLNGNPHQVKYWVMPDYLAIGSDEDFCRVPMGPIIAQTAADSFGACMPTRKLVDNVYQNAEIKLAPVTYTPVGNNNEKVEKFIEHNTAIQGQFNAAGGVLGQLVGGTKKDVVISNKIVDPSRPNHVVIYGWHQLNGVPIQPLTNIHINTYVDYSHGIRFLDSDVVIDGDTTTIQEIVQDEVLYKILSDEAGPMYQPTYISNTNLPDKPRSFGIKSEIEGELKIVMTADTQAEEYQLYLSRDGFNFDPPVTFSSDEYILQGLSPDSIYYIKLKSKNTNGTSPNSEVLAAVPRPRDQLTMLIVNGFDRTSDGNTYDFIRQHGTAVHHKGITFESASNDAVIDGLFSLTDYPVVDYILGDESTADETFSTAEQVLVAEFLRGGGRLFVSGSEIAWDLDYRGTSGDKAFIMNYLKARYSADAPGGVAGTYYSAEGIAGRLFEELTQINFDNGTHGTFDVEYADALIPMNGSTAVLNYKNVTVHKIAAVSYEGTFGSGSSKGKLIYIGFPFETIYPEGTRNDMMREILDFFYSDITFINDDHALKPDQFFLSQNYPNPFNPTTKIKFTIPTSPNTPLFNKERGRGEVIRLKVYDALGNEIATLLNEPKSPGTYEAEWNASGLPSGVYFYRLEAGNFSETKKMTLLK